MLKMKHLPTRDVLVLGWRSKNGSPYRILLRFSLPPELSGLAIQQVVVSLLREHSHLAAGSHENGLPVLCTIDPGGDQQPNGASLGCGQVEPVLPDAEGLMRMDIGKTFGGYSAGQLYSFDITAAIKAGQKQNKTNQAHTIMLKDETVRAFRCFWSARSSHSPKVSIIVKSDAELPMDDIIEYEEDWVDLYARGLTYVQKGKVGSAQVLWEEAVKRCADGSTARYIREHLAVIKGARR